MVEQASARAPGVSVAPVPYRASWIDRFGEWMNSLPGPTSLAYLTLALAAGLLYLGYKWLAGELGSQIDQVVTYLRDSAGPVVILAVIHYLDVEAAKAMAAFRPVLPTDEATYLRLRYRLTTMPLALTSWLVVSTTLASVLFVAVFGPTYARALASLGYSFSGLDAALSIANAVSYFVFFYHTVRQLLLISSIQAMHSKISLFELEAAHSFSAVTARTAVIIALLTSWTTGHPAVLQLMSSSDSASMILGGLFGVGGATGVLLGAAVFVLPLLGMHRVLRELKKQELREVGVMTQSAIDEINRRIRGNELQDLDRLKNALDALVAERDLLNKVSPWPWRGETANAVLAGLLLPVVIWIIQRILENFF